MDERLSTLGWRIPALRFRSGRTRVIRPGQRGGRWSPKDAAEELHRRRGELIGQLRRRSEGRGIPIGAQAEIVDDAITAVVMAPRGVANEHHLLGAFWLAVDHRCRRHREGRHLTRLGSRRRVEFDVAAEEVPVDANPFDALELRDRFARAADLMADLNDCERRVVGVMASRGVGPVSAARLLGLPLGEVRSAARSASAKLDRVAAIYAAGRMCEFRATAIATDAAGTANEREVRLARAHVSACVPCGRTYRRLRREMRGREFQRAAAAAFLPLPVVSVAHLGGVSKIAVSIEQRFTFLPHGSGERTAELLGGAGIAKAAVAGTAIVAAGGALTGHLVHAIEGERHQPHHRTPVALTASHPAAFAKAWSSSSRAPSAASATAHRSSPAPPSKSLGYLAVGGPSGGGGTSSSSESSNPVRATAASVGQADGTSPSEPPARPTQVGGGTSLSYLGK